MEIRSNACCFTGHRCLSAAHRALLPDRLETQIKALIDRGVCDFITGGARGFDTLAALAVLKVRSEIPSIRLLLALPCKEQTKGWTRREQALYEDILKRADDVHYLSEHYTKTCMQQRNRYMVDHSENCVFYLTAQRGGTYQTVAYAIRQDLQLFNILLVPCD